MSVPLVVNGITFNYPQEFDVNWGPTLTAWSTAVTAGMLQKAGGSFHLTSEAEFGSSYGLKALYFKAEESPLSATGVLRLANASAGIGFRNSTDSADLILTVNASNLLTYNGIPVGPLGALLNGHIYVGNVSNQPADVAMSGDVHITNTGVTTLQANTVSDSNVTAAAAIALTKLAALNPNICPVTDGSGFLVSSTTTQAEITYVHGVTSDIQTQLNALQAQITALTQTPAGTVADYAGTSAPTGWLPCDGASLLRASYPDLFTAIGTTWGAADGTHFNVPFLARSVTVGSGGAGTGVLGNTVGSTGGAETVTPTQVGHTHTENNHTHTLASAGSQASVNLTSGYANVGTGGTAAGLAAPLSSGGETLTIRSATTGNQSDTGMSTTTPTINAVSIMQPSAVVLKIIKT